MIIPANAKTFPSHTAWSQAVEAAGLRVTSHCDVENGPSEDDMYQPAFAWQDGKGIRGMFMLIITGAVLFDTEEEYNEWMMSEQAIAYEAEYQEWQTMQAKAVRDTAAEKHLDARPNAKAECCMNACDISGHCCHPDQCDDRGFITKSRDLSFEERMARIDTNELQLFADAEAEASCAAAHEAEDQ
jgi:hypothetical protein